ncbi:MAG: hypothetical protein UX09_C0038G0004 [Candidatus Uhrbacteria bacterium GW2011_GWE2_45_35]|uniref:Uncharacterized protein n=2 Tax=Candidatus Uhriibacteriota TaxID=1752732 RepID=A0A0G1JBM3_9BACT|nr:MAG: hypothetical protein UW63_C0069G0004 [Candidatus Uhrbacteria bacterium GW2011_GWF2_44_350]KKU06912.1 MAG: hypothetical protein UX09_C0038G0004 [Candidatus Uhrbacteria bacterium GW2011_GWE2_45_35]HBR80886.1 hypothetical protein [Candidatus Uhrbacteria bacterium]HCU31416.1 hypothetical protein [Candidatus Uhrbacteria bacterium]
MDLNFLHELTQGFDSQSAQAASENSGLIPYLASLLGLPAAWPEAITKMIDPNHPIFSGRDTGGGWSNAPSGFSDSRLDGLAIGNSGSNGLTLADVIGDSGNGQTTLADVVGE